MEPGCTYDAHSMHFHLLFKFLSEHLFIDLLLPLGILNKKYEVMTAIYVIDSHQRILH